MAGRKIDYTGIAQGYGWSDDFEMISDLYHRYQLYVSEIACYFDVKSSQTLHSHMQRLGFKFRGRNHQRKKPKNQIKRICRICGCEIKAKLKEICGKCWRLKRINDIQLPVMDQAEFDEIKNTRNTNPCLRCGNGLLDKTDCSTRCEQRYQYVVGMY